MPVSNVALTESLLLGPSQERFITLASDTCHQLAQQGVRLGWASPQPVLPALLGTAVPKGRAPLAV